MRENIVSLFWPYFYIYLKISVAKNNVVEVWLKDWYFISGVYSFILATEIFLKDDRHFGYKQKIPNIKTTLKSQDPKILPCRAQRKRTGCNRLGLSKSQSCEGTEIHGQPQDLIKD